MSFPSRFLSKIHLCVAFALLLGIQAIHSFEQSSYSLFQIVEDESVAAVDDGRLPINRSVFDPGKPAVSDTAEAPATTSGVQLDFTKSSFGGDTGSSGFSFDDFANDTPQSEEADSFDLDVFGKEL